MQKTSKKADTAAGTNILPQKAKVLLFPPSPACGNLPFIHGCIRKYMFSLGKTCHEGSEGSYGWYT